MAVAYLFFTRTPPKPNPSTRHTFLPPPQWVYGAILAMVVALAVRWVWLEHFPSPWRYTRLSETGIAHIQHPVQVNFGNELQLLGWDAQRGGVLLYWQALRPMQRNYSAGLALLTADGTKVAQDDAYHLARIPTANWQLGFYTTYLHLISIPPEFQPTGDLHLSVSVYDAQGNLDIVTAQGLAGYYADLGVYLP